MWKAIYKRLQHGWSLYLQGWRLAVLVVWGVPYAAASLYDFLRGEGYVKTGSLNVIIPHWVNVLWIVIGIIAFVLVTIEGSYRLSRKGVKQLETRIGEMEKQLENIQKTKPSIEVQPIKGSGPDHYLLVKNNGVAAQFSAQITLIEGQHLLPDRNPWAGFWEIGNSNFAAIQRNQTDRLKIVAIDEKERKRRLRFYYWDSKTHSPNSYNSNWATKDRGFSRKNRGKIRVTISSAPDLLEHSYMLEKEFDIWALRWIEQWVKVEQEAKNDDNKRSTKL